MPLDNSLIPDTSTMTSGERLIRLETTVSEGLKNVKEALERNSKTFDELKADLKSLKDGFVSKDKFDALEGRVNALEDNETWIARAVVGAVITSVIAAAVGAFIVFK